MCVSVHTRICSCLIHVGVVWFDNSPRPLCSSSSRICFELVFLCLDARIRKWSTYVHRVHDVMTGAEFMLIGEMLLYHSVIATTGYAQYPK